MDIEVHVFLLVLVHRLIYLRTIVSDTPNKEKVDVMKKNSEVISIVVDVKV